MIDNLRTEHIILGIDPGTLYMGYAILHTQGKQVDILEFGAYDVHKLEGQYPRLQKEFFFLQELIDKYHPSCLSIETQFVDKNPESYKLRVSKDGGDVDAITAATITSRAFTKAVDKAYKAFMENKAQFMKGGQDNE